MSTASPAASASSVLGSIPEPGDDRVGLDRAARARRDRVRAGRDDGLLGQHLDTLLAVIVGNERGEWGGQEPRGDARIREDHRHLPAGRRERGRDLGADEAAADDHDPRALGGRRTQVVVVVERPEVDETLGAGQSARRSAGREQKPVPPVRFALVVGRLLRVEVERDDAAAEPQVDCRLRRMAPDLLLVAAEPELLRERRPGVGSVLLGADEADRAFWVVLADALGGGVAGHSAADDQVARLTHDGLVSCVSQGRESSSSSARRLSCSSAQAGQPSEMCVQSGQEHVGVRAGDFELDVAVELGKALVTAELRLGRAEQPQQRQAQVGVLHHHPPVRPWASRCARRFRRAS